jgi:hypothetical protein
MNGPVLVVSPIAKALALAQAEIADPIRSKEMKVPGRPSRKYAGLDDLFRAVRASLTKHGIAVTQSIEYRDGRVFLASRLIHESGDSLRSEWELTQKGGPQDRGAELTYAKRYTLAGLVGVADVDDDDAESVSHPEPTKGRGRNRQPDTTPTTEDRALADRVAAERAAKVAADEARRAAHHPSWEADRASFFGEVDALGLNGDIACAAIERASKGVRPSAMDPIRRSKSLAWLSTDAGVAAYDAIVVEREQAGGEVTP